MAWGGRTRGDNELHRLPLRRHGLDARGRVVRPHHRAAHVGDVDGDGRDDLISHDVTSGQRWLDYASADDLAAGRLRVVLAEYAPTVPGFFLYFPSRAQRSTPLRLFVETTREVLLERKRAAR
jgi:DNA-binding transcriptional LysR family regulator